MMPPLRKSNRAHNIIIAPGDVARVQQVAAGLPRSMRDGFCARVSQILYISHVGGSVTEIQGSQAIDRALRELRVV